MTNKPIWINDTNELVTRWHWNPDHQPTFEWPLHGMWQQQSTMSEFDARRLHSFTSDDPIWSKPHMQDLIRTNCSWDYSSWSHIDGVRMSPNPAFNRRFYNIGIPGEAVRMSDAVVTNLLTYDATGKPFAPWAAVSEGAAALYARLRDKPIRTTWIPRMDPLDTDFSIWYTIRDIVEFPKLLRGLVKNVRNIVSFLGNPRWRVMLQRRTLKEVASSHLAVEYGWKPTLDGMKEFIDLILEWYKGELARKARFGRTRTTRGPAMEIEPGRVETHRLRFLTAGAGYSYASARVVLGPLVSRQTVKHYFICPELTGVVATLKLLCDRLGILEPAVIWDQVPFSFVVDWFFDVSTFLHRKKPRQMKVTPVIADWGESLSREIQVVIDLDYVGAIELQEQERPIKERLCSCRIYQRARKRQFPDVPLETITKDLIGNGVTTHRAINGSAIVIGRSVRSRNGNGGDYRNR